jgi:hypothetical protein
MVEVEALIMEQVFLAALVVEVAAIKYTAATVRGEAQALLVKEMLAELVLTEVINLPRILLQVVAVELVQ